MKKIIILAIVSLFAFAQTAHAQFYVGGSFEVTSQFKSQGNTSINLSPDLGVSVGDWCFGSAIGFSYDHFSSQKNQFSFSLTPYAEYFFWSSGPFSFYVEAGMDLKWNPTGTGTSFDCVPYLDPGVSFTITEHWAVMGQVGILSYSTLEKQLTFGNKNFAALSLGLYYNL